MQNKRVCVMLMLWGMMAACGQDDGDAPPLRPDASADQDASQDMTTPPPAQADALRVELEREVEEVGQRVVLGVSERVDGQWREVDAAQVLWTITPADAVRRPDAISLIALEPGVLTLHARVGELEAQAELEAVPARAERSLHIKPSPLRVMVGQRLEVRAEVRDRDGALIETLDQPRWRVLEEAVARWDGEHVEALSPGVTTLEAISDDGLSASAPLEVFGLSELVIEPALRTLRVDEPLQLSVSAKDDDGAPVLIEPTQVQWSVQNARLAQISEAGELVALRPSDQLIVRVEVAGYMAQATFNAALFYTAFKCESIWCCGLIQSGAAFCMGTNSEGQLGDGTQTPSYVPIRVDTTERFDSLLMSFERVCALTSQGEAWCWGRNVWGELGDGTFVSRSRPVPVNTMLRFNQLVASGWTTCGLTLDGAVYCWGQAPMSTDTVDYLRNVGPRASAPVTAFPVLIEAGDFDELRGGNETICARSASTERWSCMGTNRLGSLGNGTTQGSSSLVEMAGDQLLVDIKPGFVSGCGLDASGLVWCWGGQIEGRLGRFVTPIDGPGATNDFSAVPIRTGWNERFEMIDHGGATMCGVTRGEEVKCWGSNASGCALGQPLTLPYSEQLQTVSGLPKEPSRITMGLYMGCALGESSGQVYCWGLQDAENPFDAGQGPCQPDAQRLPDY